MQPEDILVSVVDPLVPYLRLGDVSNLSLVSTTLHRRIDSHTVLAILSRERFLTLSGMLRNYDLHHFCASRVKVDTYLSIAITRDDPFMILKFELYVKRNFDVPMCRIIFGHLLDYAVASELDLICTCLVRINNDLGDGKQYEEHHFGNDRSLIDTILDSRYEWDMDVPSMRKCISDTMLGLKIRSTSIRAIDSLRVTRRNIIGKSHERLGRCVSHFF